MNWHTLQLDKIFGDLASSDKGLSDDVVKQKQETFGKNQIEAKKKKPAWWLFLHQFADFMIIVLMIAAIISGIAGDRTDMIIILVIVLLNATVGFIQEYRAEKAMEALIKMATPFATVVRKGETVSLSSIELVPGDIVLLEAGNSVPADLRLIETHSLRIEESSLTGESVPADKIDAALPDENVQIGDRKNMAYKGTMIINGRGRGIVVATGMQTELGAIAKMLQGKESATPLQKRMADFGKKLSYLILGICVLLFVVGVLRGEDPVRMMLLSISLAVAAIPEALPALITIALARGAKKLVKQNVLIRKLPAVETLGSVTYICSDKTGTLTQNKMTVVEIRPEQSDFQIEENVSMLEVGMALNHDVRKQKEGGWFGDSTEVAIIQHFKNADQVDEFLQKFPRVAEIPFDSDRKRMTTIHRFEKSFIAFTKGAVESVATISQKKENHDDIIKQSIEMSAQGLRVLGFAFRVLPDLDAPAIEVEMIEKEMQFAGMVAMIDPPRENIQEAITECRTAGIQPVMITGDHKETAASIAKQIGILNKNEMVVTGQELQKLNGTALDDEVEKIRVYARVSPQQKLDIVKALQRKNHFVAMTGDGVNDAPSLKTANIGIAMGITGTDVSKEAAHMILLDDNFATIVKAVREGRRIYDNIRKFVKYIMTCNSAEIWTIFLAPLIGLPIPLLPIHILWINLVTDGLPGLALSSEKADKNIMQRPPRRTNETLFAGGIGIHIIWVGLLMAFVTLGVQAWAIHNDNERWQTMVFTVLSFSQIGHVMAIRSDHEFIYQKGFFTNKQLTIAVTITIVLQLAIIYLPFANELFKTKPLTMFELAICFIASAIVFHAVEAEKLIKQRRRKSIG